MKTIWKVLLCFLIFFGLGAVVFFMVLGPEDSCLDFNLCWKWLVP